MKWKERSGCTAAESKTDETMSTLLMLIPGLPLAASILTAVLGPRALRSQSHWPTIMALIGSFVCSAALLLQLVQEQPLGQGSEAKGFEYVCRIWTWANVAEAYDQPLQPPGDTTHSLVEGGLRDFRIDVTLRADALTGIMLAMVTFVSSLVAIFAVGYMRGDPGYWRFFSYISLFVFSMTMLVSVSNFVLLYVFWEAVGVCSYLLIGFWYHKPAAAAAGKKAFLVNRVGDFGFALALFLIWTSYGTLNFHDENSVQPAFESAAVATSSAQSGNTVPRGVLSPSRIAANDYYGGVLGLAICLLLMLGACGKSAQFPLHVWLPDAMEGPTPVSALIHAATMVTAGVYMVTRCTPLFVASPDAQLVVAVIGGFTALLAGLIALTQFDLKRVLAYSTISQLGYMFLALGTGTLAGITAGMFHLFTHAFFKALLFLGAGSVMHAMGHVIDMRRFGGLRKLMPITHFTFLAGCLALAGVFPLSGFWSKDAIVSAVYEKAYPAPHSSAADEHAGADANEDVENAASPVRAAAETVLPLTSDQRAMIYGWLFYAALFTAFLTALYTFRAFFMTFYGPQRVPHEAGHHAHESPEVMSVPLAVLAAGAIFVGLYFEFTGSFAGFLQPLLPFEPHAHEINLTVAVTSTLIALGGIGVASYLYLGDPREVQWLASLLKFDWMARLADVGWVSRLKQLRPVAAVNHVARAVGLGWLASAVGYVLLLVVLILAAPLLLGYFLSPYRLSYHKFFFDEIYGALVVWPLRALAAVSFWFDRWIVDALVNFCGRIPPAAGTLMRSLQMGLVQFYALAMVLGVLILIAARMFGLGG
jgi:NADH-quinone oxidoreductase subunit L